jgi:SAM-dependent methyltransferase
MRYTVYKWLQDYVHTGHQRQRAILLREFESHVALNTQARQGSRSSVLELACGGGDLATVFPAETYLGIDLTADRIAAARREYPGYRFAVCDVNSTGFQALVREFDFIFCHGLLHHIDDQSCHTLLDQFQHLTPRPTTFVAIEPILPVVWKNPLGFFLARLDAGHYIRPPQRYQRFFENCQLRTEYLNYFPRWPVHMEAYIARYL